ncbi:MAG: Antidote-toxin recognition MazE, bacterial antitoxin, partial [Pseudomonadota bacterium]
MPKVTRKLQITLPKRMAEAVGIGPGDEVEFAVAGEG